MCHSAGLWKNVICQHSEWVQRQLPLCPAVVMIIKCFFKGLPPFSSREHSLSRVRWMPWCQREDRTLKHSGELTVLVDDPLGPVKGPLLLVFPNRGHMGTKRGRVHSWKGSCTCAWHFSYLHCLIVSVDVFMIFSASVFVCGSFFSTNALLHLPPSFALSFYLSLLLVWYPAL